MSVPEPFDTAPETRAGQVGGMGVALLIGEGVVLAVIGYPCDHRPFDGHRTDYGDEGPKRARGLKRAVGEHAVVAEGYAEAGDDVEADEQAKLERADGAIPQKH